MTQQQLNATNRHAAALGYVPANIDEVLSWSPDLAFTLQRNPDNNNEWQAILHDKSNAITRHGVGNSPKLAKADLEFKLMRLCIKK
jgi:hypothetical protein